VYLSLLQSGVKYTQSPWLTIALHTLSWGVPLWLVSFALAFRALGRDDFSASIGWCWISNPKQISWPNTMSPEWRVFFWQLVAGKGIEIISYVATPFLYIASKRVLQATNERILMSHSQLREALQEADRKLVLVPVVFLFGRIWGTLRLLLDFFVPALKVKSWFWLAILQGVGDSAQGWANCLLFCFFTKVLRRKIVGAILNCVKKQNDRLMEHIH